MDREKKNDFLMDISIVQHTRLLLYIQNRFLEPLLQPITLFRQLIAVQDFRIELQFDAVQLLAQTVHSLLELMGGELVLLIVFQLFTQIDDLSVIVFDGFGDTAALSCEGKILPHSSFR